MSAIEKLITFKNGILVIVISKSSRRIKRTRIYPGKTSTKLYIFSRKNLAQNIRLIIIKKIVCFTMVQLKFL